MSCRSAHQGITYMPVPVDYVDDLWEDCHHLQVDAVMMTRWRLDVMLMIDDRQMVMRMKFGRGNLAELLSNNSSSNIDKCFR